MHLAEKGQCVTTQSVQWVLQLGSNCWDQWNGHKSQAQEHTTETYKYYEKYFNLQ